MQNINTNSLTTDELSAFAKTIDKGTANPNDLFRFFNWLQAIQNDLNSIPSVYTIKDVKAGNFPPLPVDKVGLLFLTSGTYEAAVVASVDKWRRMYDGATYDIGTAIP